MSRNATISRAQIAELFDKGAERKMAERERFAMMSVEDPSKGRMYSEIAEYLDLDIRYYRMAAHYYRGEYDSLDTGYDEDLLILIGISEPSPRMYAAYLRGIDKTCRSEEEITHKALKGIKDSIRSVIEAQ